MTTEAPRDAAAWSLVYDGDENRDKASDTHPATASKETRP